MSQHGRPINGPVHNRGRGRGRGRGQGYTAARGRSMEAIASISRSSGLEKDGDTLKDWKVQEDYLEFIQQRLDHHFTSAAATGVDKDQRQYEEENILILFRKLREGISSSMRRDAFAIRVYEASLALAIIFESPRQVTSIIPHLVPGLYLACPTAQSPRLPTILLSLLHYLHAEYPSQRSFRRHLDALPVSLLSHAEAARKWLLAVASSLRTRNYTKFERLTDPAAYKTYCSSSADEFGIRGSTPEQAFHIILDALRAKARGAAWSVIRSAYRELSCQTDNDWTRAWLIRSLALKSVVPGATGTTLDDWLDSESKQGHVRKKDGIEGRWIVCKPR